MDLDAKAFDNYIARLAMRLQIIALNVGGSLSSINAMFALFHSKFTVSMLPLDAILCKVFNIVLAVLFKARYTRAGAINRIS